MTTKLEQAFPLASHLPGAADLRTYLSGIFAGVFDTVAQAEAEDFSIQPYIAIAIRGNDGAFDWYAYDDADTTTASDAGVTTIVVSGRRYKKAEDFPVTYLVKSATTTAQPASPTLGDAYVLPAAPTGTDWASKAKNFARYTARGWIFKAPQEGNFAYVEDESTYYHHNSAGNWVSGLPLGAIADGSITPMKLAHPFAILKVEDQRNAPPGSVPGAGTMYQVGTSPTGDFAGESNNIARSNGTSYDFITSAEGDTIYRKDLNLPYTYRSGTWEPTIAAAGVQQVKRATATDEVLAEISSASPVYATSVALTSEAAKKLRITVYNLQAKLNLAAAGFSAGIYRDTESSPLFEVLSAANGTDIDDTTYGSALAKDGFFQVIVDVLDGDEHDYHVGVKWSTGSATRTPTVNYEFTIEEIALS